MTRSVSNLGDTIIWQNSNLWTINNYCCTLLLCWLSNEMACWTSICCFSLYHTVVLVTNAKIVGLNIIGIFNIWINLLFNLSKWVPYALHLYALPIWDSLICSWLGLSVQVRERYLQKNAFFLVVSSKSLVILFWWILNAPIWTNLSFLFLRWERPKIWSRKFIF